VRQIYIEHGATYRKPYIVYRSKAERESELLHQQQEFSSRITRIMMSEPNTDIIYINETNLPLLDAACQSVDQTWDESIDA
jgi:hypothetical protein